MLEISFKTQEVPGNFMDELIDQTVYITQPFGSHIVHFGAENLNSV